jgi:tryptophanyl-tRNA synthetase
MVTPLGWLLRVPTFKEKARLHPQNINYGLVGYPVLMTSDIVLYKAEVVPVGEDQLPHLEIAREIVRRFNEHFGETFPEPQAKLTTFPLVIGLDGKDKMSKSLGNHIELAATAEETTKKIMSAVTDPARKLRTDVGHPEICNIFKLRSYFEPPEVDALNADCRAARVGCVDCKKALAVAVNHNLAPLRARRAELAARPEYVKEVMDDGARRAQAIARQTLAEVKQKMGLV